MAHPIQKNHSNQRKNEQDMPFPKYNFSREVYIWRSAYFWQMSLTSNLKHEEILEYHKVDKLKNTQC
jgi:hypothetical protein